MTGGESKCWGSSIVLCPLSLSETTSLGLGVIIGTLAQLLEIQKIGGKSVFKKNLFII